MGFSVTVSVKNQKKYRKLKIADGRKVFWQWDTNCYLLAYGIPAGCEVHFDIPNVDAPLKTLVEEKDGDLICRVPDEFLQTAGYFTAWVYTAHDDGGKTTYSRRFIVNAREKPPEYVYTPAERYSYEALKERIDELKKEVVTAYVDENNMLVIGYKQEDKK